MLLRSCPMVLGVMLVSFMPISDFRNRMRRAAADANRTLKGDSLGGKAARNAGWLTVGYGVDLCTRFVSSVILTRLLDPTSYGLMSTVTVFLTIATMLSDLGLKPIVLTDKRGDEKEFLGMIWTIQVVRGFVIALLVGIAAGVWDLMQNEGWIASTSSYANPLLPDLLFLVGFAMILRGFSSINEFRIARHLETRAVQRVAIGTRIISTILTVSLAFMWPSVWALAIAMLIEQALRSAGIHMFVAGPRMTWRWDWPEVKKILHHSRWIALNSGMTVATQSADKIMIGYAFGLHTLGIYSVSIALFLSVNSFVNQLANGMGVPIMRALSDKTPEERKKAYFKFRMPVDLFCIAAGAAFTLLGPLLFQHAYDPRYHEGGLYLAIMGVKMVLTPLQSANHYLTANRRFKLIWAITTTRTIWFFCAMGVAAWFHSIELAVVAVALERLPEILIYRLKPGTGIPHDWKRDGLLLGIAAASLAYTLV